MKQTGRAWTAGRCTSTLLTCAVLAFVPWRTGIADPVALSDEHLAELTAGAAPASADAAPASQPPALPVNRISSDRDSVGSRVVLFGASSRHHRSDKVDVDAAQEGLSGVNLVNATGSDTASGVNVVDRRVGRERAPLAASAQLGQRNDIVQTRERTGQIGAVATAGPSEARSSRHSGFESRSHRVTAYQERAETAESIRRQTTFIDAKVAPKKLFEDGIGVDAILVDPPRDFQVTLPNFGFDGVLRKKCNGCPFDDDGFHDKDGARHANVTGRTITLDLGKLELGEVKLKGNDIVIGESSITLPSFSLGEIEESDGLVRNWVQFLKRTIDIGKVRINKTLTLEGRVIEGANPIPGITEFGAGFVVAGRGKVDSKEGLIQFDMVVPIDLGKFGDSAIVDFTIPWTAIREIKTIVPGKRAFDPLDGGIDDRKTLSIADRILPKVDLRVSLTREIALPEGFQMTFDGAVCFAATEVCGVIEISNVERVTVENSFAEYRSAEESHEESHRTETSLTRVGGASVSGARADLLVVGSSSADDEVYSVVIVTDGAQRDQRALNALNAANAIVGSGVNVAATRSGTARSGLSAQSLSQTNTFTQIGGLGR